MTLNSHFKLIILIRLFINLPLSQNDLKLTHFLALFPPNLENFLFFLSSDAPGKR